MPDIDRYSFTYKEVLEALVKKAEIHQGIWQLVVNLGLSGLNAGPSEDQVVPAALVAITNLGLQKATPESPSNLTIDAAAVNPASTSS